MLAEGGSIMEKINMMNWVDDAIAAEKKQGFLILSFPAIQKMGITVRELVQSADLQAQAMKIVADLTPGACASVSMMDLSVEAEAFGSQVVFSDDEVPTIVGSIVEEEDDAQELEIPKIGAGRTQIYIDAIEKAAKLITDRPVFAGVIGPFSLAGRLMDVTEAMINCYEEPDMVHILLDKVSQFIIQYINAYKAVGANGVVIAEPLAGLLGPDIAQEFSGDYIKKIVEAAQEDDFLIIYHNCGNSVIPQIDSIITNGCRVLHFGNAIDMADVLPLIPDDRIAMGNVDPSSKFRSGTPEAVREDTLKLMNKCAAYKNFIPSSGCDLPPLTPWENIQAFFDAVDEFNK